MSATTTRRVSSYSFEEIRLTSTRSRLSFRCSENDLYTVSHYRLSG